MKDKKKVLEQFDLSLSNSVIKLFIRKGNNIAFHLNSEILVSTDKYFDSKLVKSIKGKFKLNNEEIEFNRIGWITNGGKYQNIYDGETKVIEVRFETSLNYRFLKNQVTYIEISFEYILSGTTELRTIKTIGLIRKMYDERTWDDN